jgi:hypothetical protein
MTFIFDKSQFQALQTNFKDSAHNESNSSSDAILYNIIRGKDLKRGFTPITNQNKLNNGADPWLGFKQALLTARWAAKRQDTLFGMKITDEQRAAILAQLEG